MVCCNIRPCSFFIFSLSLSVSSRTTVPNHHHEHSRPQFFLHSHYVIVQLRTYFPLRVVQDLAL